MKSNSSASDIIKKISFLCASFVVGFGIYYVFEMYRTPDNIGADNIKGSETDRSELLAQQSYYQLDDFQQVPEEDQAPPPVETVTNDSVGQVLGAGDGCKDFSDTGCESRSVAFQPVCVEGSASVDLKGGNASDNGATVKISKNSVIEVWKVTSPLAILSGIESPKYNTMAMTYANPNFYPANSLVPKDYVARAMKAPGEESYMIDYINDSLDKPSADGRGAPFSVNTKASIGSGAGGGSAPPNKATVEDELNGRCEEFWKTHPNSGGANVNGEEANKRNATSVDPIPERRASTDELECIYIDPNNIDLPNADVFETCLNRRSAYDGIIGAILPAARWLQCLADEANCEQTELFGIVIDAIFGKNDQCVAGSCSDQYFDFEVAAGIPPTEIDSYREAGHDGEYDPKLEPHYVTTPCKVRIDYGKIYDVPCLWDISPYKARYEMERNERFPNDPEFPTWEEYWMLVEDAAERRGAACST